VEEDEQRRTCIDISGKKQRNDGRKRSEEMEQYMDMKRVMMWSEGRA
jgi:hypothetical protein